MGGPSGKDLKECLGPGTLVGETRGSDSMTRPRLTPRHPEVEGLVLSDQLKNFDWDERKAAFKGTISLTVLREMLCKVAALLTIEP